MMGGGGAAMSLNCVTLGVSSSKEIQRATTAGPIGMLMSALSPSCFSWCYLTIFPLSYMCRRRRKRETKLCAWETFIARIFLSLTEKKKEKKKNPGLSYLFFFSSSSSSSSSALTRQGIPEPKTFFEAFVFICRIFWYSSRGRTMVAAADELSCFDWLLHEIQANVQSPTRSKKSRRR